MRLLIRRGQESTLGGAVRFTLGVRAEVSDDEIKNIARYKLGKSMLYSRGEITDPGKGLLGAASRLAFKMTNISVTVDDLVNGKHIEMKDIVEMLAVVEQLKEAARNFKALLDAAAHFGGEEVIEI